MSKNALLIFIKNPELGKCKTRIAATAGDERALQIYLELLRHTREIAEEVDANRLLFYSNFVDEKDAWSSEKFQKYVQNNGDLGERMSAGFERAFQENERVLIIGSDCASLTTEIVEDAFQALESHDFVLGPTFDGGYYMLGMRHWQPSVFQDIEWSTESVFETTKARISTLNASLYFAPTLSDIDYEEDWEKYGWDL